MTTTASTHARGVTTAPASPAEYRARLETLRANCLAERAKASSVAAGDGADPVEWARSTALQLNLDEIEAALSRIEAGTYGTCVHCGFPIPRGRLELRPFARGCVPCSEPR